MASGCALREIRDEEDNANGVRCTADVACVVGWQREFVEVAGVQDAGESDEASKLCNWVAAWRAAFTAIVAHFWSCAAL